MRLSLHTARPLKLAPTSWDATMVGHRCVVAAFVECEKMGVCMSVAVALGLGTFEVGRGICSEPVVVIVFRDEMADTF